MGFTKDQVKAIGADVNAAVAEVLKAHGVELQRQSGSYDSTSYTMRLTIVPVARDASGVNQAGPEAADWRRYAAGFGLDPALLGQTVPYGNKDYTIVGLLPGRHRYPVLAVDALGRKTTLPVRELNAAVARAAAAR